MGEAWPPGDAARLMRTVKEAEVQGSESVDEAEVVRPGGRFLHEVDRHTRSPSALGDLTPAACEEQWHQAHVQTLDAHEEHLQSGPVLGVHFTELLSKGDGRGCQFFARVLRFSPNHRRLAALWFPPLSLFGQ